MEVEPFPHVIVDDAFVQFSELSETFPEVTRLGASRALYEGIESCWRKFIIEHCHPNWANTLLQMFDEHIGEMMKQMPQELRVGVRETGEFDLMIDTVLCDGKIEGPHVNSKDEIVSGFLFLDEGEFRFFPDHVIEQKPNRMILFRSDASYGMTGGRFVNFVLCANKEVR